MIYKSVINKQKYPLVLITLHHPNEESLKWNLRFNCNHHILFLLAIHYVTPTSQNEWKKNNKLIIFVQFITKTVFKQSTVTFLDSWTADWFEILQQTVNKLVNIHIIPICFILLKCIMIQCQLTSSLNPKYKPVYCHRSVI